MKYIADIPFGGHFALEKRTSQKTPSKIYSLVGQIQNTRAFVAASVVGGVVHNDRLIIIGTNRLVSTKERVRKEVWKPVHLSAFSAVKECKGKTFRRSDEPDTTFIGVDSLDGAVSFGNNCPYFAVTSVAKNPKRTLAVGSLLGLVYVENLPLEELSVEEEEVWV